METLCLWLCMLLFLVQYPTGFSFPNNNNSSMNHLCSEDERELLLQLKQELPPISSEYYYKTKYWKRNRDCCLWDGVTCDYYTGHVIALDLGCSDSDFNICLTGELKSNSSLFHLAQLRSLNLAFNDFGGSTLPSQFGRLNALTHLNLHSAGFGGEIPMEFYHLSNLLSLDLSFNFDIRDVKTLFGNMTRIRVLVLAGVYLNSEMPMNMSSFLTHLDLGETKLQGNLPAIIFEKPNLQFLSLHFNYDLTGSLPKSLNWSNVHSINTLDLSETKIKGRLPDSIGLMTNLKYMDLSDCSFSGPIPESIGNITALTFMDLSRNDFSGRLPSTISNLRHLPSLKVSHNHLEGQLPDIFSGYQNLTQLDLSNNNLEGRIPSSLTNMSQLEYLDISSNALTGPFPSRAGHGLQNLVSVDLSNNSIKGTIPPWLFTLPSVVVLGLSYNRLTGRIGKLNSQTLNVLDLSSNRLIIELDSFYNLTNIESLKVSHNTVTEHDGADDIVNVTFPYLQELVISSCEIKKFPKLLQSSMPSLHTLDLSNNTIHGPIPTWFTSNPLDTFYYLDLSSNFFTCVGDLPWQGLQYLDLHSNSLRGTFPTSVCNMSQLEIINFSDNKLIGNIPECLGKFSELTVLDLRKNEFHGKIPTVGAMYKLVGLGLNGNRLEGPLPRSLANCTGLQVIDLGNNMIQDTFPWWLHTFPQLKILILKSNSFRGSISSPAFTNNSFTNLQIFDLSFNNFTGLLPEKLFASLQAIKNQGEVYPNDELYMRSGSDGRAWVPRGIAPNQSFPNIRGIWYQYSVTLSVKGADSELTKVLKILTTIDLSSNNFEGSIPESISYLASLRLLNLSHNKIHGSIPPELSRMTYLEQLDLSSNRLTGGIPKTLTNLTFLVVLDLSNNHLIGPIPHSNQFSTFENESYAGNSRLCGAPLTRSCGDEKEPPSAGEFDDEEEEESGLMMGFTWKVVVMGYGCGIVLGFVLGNVMISMEKPRWLARFVYLEAVIILRRRSKRRRVVQGRR